MNFKLLKFILFILGLISLIYSWLQSFPVSGRSDEYASLLLVRTVKHYVFLACAFFSINIDTWQVLKKKSLL